MYSKSILRGSATSSSSSLFTVRKKKASGDRRFGSPRERKTRARDRSLLSAGRSRSALECGRRERERKREREKRAGRAAGFLSSSLRNFFPSLSLSFSVCLSDPRRRRSELLFFLRESAILPICVCLFDSLCPV